VTSLDELRAVVAATAPEPAAAAYLEKVRARAYATTDADVQTLKDAGLSEDAIFEQTVAAAIDEGLRRLDAAERAIG
jgi:hypothetical protein